MTRGASWDLTLTKSGGVPLKHTETHTEPSLAIIFLRARA